MTTSALPPTGQTSARPRPRRRIAWLFVALTSLAVAVYFPTQYTGASLETLSRAHVGLAPVYADRPWVIQIVFYVHIVFAGLALFLGPFQFLKSVRRRSPALHRWTGRAYVLSVAVGGIAGFIMAFFNSAALVGFFGFGSLALLWLWTTFKAYRAVRNRDIDAHQAWMIRSFALTYAAVMLRVWLLTFNFSLTAIGLDPDRALTVAYAAVPFLCWLPNIVFAEFLIRARGLPALRMQTSAEAREQRGETVTTPVG